LATCESCKSIDVRRWHRERCLEHGQNFSVSGKPNGNINVRTETDAVVLEFRVKPWGSSAWDSVTQRVTIVRTPCHLGGARPWFVCVCGRRCALLFGTSRLFTCRKCAGLHYETQQENPRLHNLSKAQKIRQHLGGTGNMLEPFPPKPRHMRWKTYQQLRRRAERAHAVSLGFVAAWLRRRGVDI